MPLPLFILCWLMAAWHGMAVAEERDAALVREFAAVKPRYQRWGLRLNVRQAPVPCVGDEVGKLDELSWDIDPSAWSPVTSRRYLRDGAKFRYDKSVAGKPSQHLSFDGVLLRKRGGGTMENMPLDKHQLNVTARPRFPHLISPLGLDLPDLRTLLGLPEPSRSVSSETEGSGDRSGAEAQRFLDQMLQQTQPHVESGAWNGQPCWRVDWQVNNVTAIHIWLSRQYDLLPIRQVITQPGSTWIIETVAFQSSNLAGHRQWFPRRMLALHQQQQRCLLTDVDSVVDGKFVDASCFSKLPTSGASRTGGSTRVSVSPLTMRSLPVNFRPTPPIVKQTQPAVDLLPMVIAGSCGMIMLLTLASLLIHLFSRRRESLCRWSKTRSGWLDAMGIGFALAMALLTIPLPGWFPYGLTFFAAGSAGLLWSLFAIVLRGRWGISVRASLALVAFASLTFAGWRSGMDRLAARQRMIVEVEASGGQIDMAFLQSENRLPLQVPGWLTDLVGDASAGYVSQAILPADLFTADNVRHWCFDEVERVSILSQTPSPVPLESAAVEAIPANNHLTEFCVYGRPISKASVRSLQRFKRIERVSFPCGGMRIGSAFSEFDLLSDLHLTDVIIDSALVDFLFGHQCLRTVRLTSPVFETCNDTDTVPSIRQVVIDGATIDSTSLALLSRVPGSLSLNNCRFQLQAIKPLEFSKIEELAIRGGNFDDMALAKFAGCPRLQKVTCSRCQVTHNGLEAFSRARPDVAIKIR